MKKIISICLCFVIVAIPITNVFAGFSLGIKTGYSTGSYGLSPNIYGIQLTKILNDGIALEIASEFIDSDMVLLSDFCLDWVIPKSHIKDNVIEIFLLKYMRNKPDDMYLGLGIGLHDLKIDNCDGTGVTGWRTLYDGTDIFLKIKIGYKKKIASKLFGFIELKYTNYNKVVAKYTYLHLYGGINYNFHI